MIKHVVMFKFKSSTADDDISRMEKGLSALPGLIPEIRQYELGRNVVHSDRSFDFGLVAGFDDLDALQRNSRHPRHHELLKLINEICDSIRSFDFESNEKT